MSTHFLAFARCFLKKFVPFSSCYGSFMQNGIKKNEGRCQEPPSPTIVCRRSERSRVCSGVSDQSASQGVQRGKFAVKTLKRVVFFHPFCVRTRRRNDPAVTFSPLCRKAIQKCAMLPRAQTVQSIAIWDFPTRSVLSAMASPFVRFATAHFTKIAP